MDHYCHLKKIFWPARSLLRIKTGRSDIPSLWTRLEITVGLKAMWFFFVQTLMVALGLSLLTFVVSGYGQWHDVTWHDNDFSKSPFLCHQGGGRFKRFLRNHSVEGVTMKAGWGSEVQRGRLTAVQVEGTESQRLERAGGRSAWVAVWQELIPEKVNVLSPKKKKRAH